MVRDDWRFLVVCFKRCGRAAFFQSDTQALVTGVYAPWMDLFDLILDASEERTALHKAPIFHIGSLNLELVIDGTNSHRVAFF